MKENTRARTVCDQATTPRPSRRGGAGTGLLNSLVVLLTLSISQVATAASWQLVGKMTEARNRPTATLLMDGTVLVTGGMRLNGGKEVTLPSTERFDPKTNTFTPSGRMSIGRFDHAAVRLQDGRVLVLGGQTPDFSSVLASAEVFDPATSSFSSVGDMTVGRGLPTATLLPDGHVLVVGGADAEGKLLATAELFDPTTGAFLKTGSLAGPRGNHAAVGLSDGRVVILGGFDDTLQAVRRVEIYDPTSGIFAVLGETSAARAALTATLLPEGQQDRILVAGGYAGLTKQGNVLNPQNTVELYDPATGQSRMTGTLSAPRFLHTAVLREDGHVLLAGGISQFAPSGIHRSADLVKPTGEATATEPMSDARFLAASVLLPDKRVLVLGGTGRSTGGSFAPLDTAEAYAP
jgi:hypothetical protein